MEENNNVLSPDMSFIRDSVMDLKKTGKCYAYKKYQVEEIQKRCLEKYNKKTTYKENGWYYIITVCK